MRRFGLIAVVALLVAAVTAPAIAWEFSMKGDWEWRYRYWTRTGNNDIFGEMDGTHVNLGLNHLFVFPTAATTNRVAANFGVLAGQNNYGSDMSLTDNRMTIFPKVGVNKAISLQASVNLTSLGIWSDGQPYDSRVIAPVTSVTYNAAPPGVTVGTTTTYLQNVGYVNSLYVPLNDRPVAANVPNTYVTVQWVKASIHTPMLDFSLGYKTSSIGIGLWKHACNRASASFSVSANYGPFKIGFSPYFDREQSAWFLGTSTSRNTGPGSTQRQDDRRDYFRAIMGEIVYRSGDLEVQLVSDSYHQPNSSTITGTTAAAPFRGAGLTTVPRPSEDILRYRIAMAVKYFNGRFFFHGEADWFNRWRAGRGTADPGTNPPATNFVQRVGRDNAAWLYGAEVGMLTGPSKVTINYVRATGDDPSTRHTTEDAADSESGVTSCYMKEWGYLMYYLYGTGDGWDAEGYGQPTNFHHLGVKLDYAVASNLNFFAVYSQAWRDQPNAYRVGGDYRIQARQWTNTDIWDSQNGAFVGHAVPNHARDIGYEVDLGCNWKLLEGLTWTTTFAYWKPGNWWSYAYPNTAYLYRLNPVGGANANPNNTAAGEANATWNIGRDINALMAVETKLLINF